MDHYGFVKVAAGVPLVKVADPAYNAIQLEQLILQAASQGVRVVVFPELCLTGYSCADLFQKPLLVSAAERVLGALLRRTESTDILFIVGLPVQAGTTLLNAAAVCYRGEILGIVPKTYLPNFHETCESRWFTSSLEWGGGEMDVCGQMVPVGTDLLFEAAGMKFGVEIGEDLWAVVPPSSRAALQGADVIFNLSASAALAGKHAYVCELVAQQSARCLCGYVYASCGFGESTTDVAFSGTALIYENGIPLSFSERFSTTAQLIEAEVDVERIRTERTENTSFRSDFSYEMAEPYEVIESGMPVMPVLSLSRFVSPTPFVAKGRTLNDNCQEIFNIQVSGLATRLSHTGLKTVTLGISGGLDSTLALLVCAKTFDKLGLPRKNIIGVTMPGFGTTDRTYQNALSLMKSLGITLREVDIKKSCLQHFSDIGHNEKVKDVTYENTQARERTQVLMDIANQTGGIVIGTGDLSELALGWATYNGDHMSMYGVNSGVPKTLVRSLVAWVAAQETSKKTQSVLADILDTPISPELLPAQKGKIAQKTEDLVGPYELHDFFLFYFLRYGFSPSKIYFLAKHAFGKKYSAAVIKKWLKVFFQRFFAQQFKRSCLPDGPKAGVIGLSPRGDWRMPSDASAQVWLSDIERLK